MSTRPERPERVVARLARELSATWSVGLDVVEEEIRLVGVFARTRGANALTISADDLTEYRAGLRAGTRLAQEIWLKRFYDLAVEHGVLAESPYVSGDDTGSADGERPRPGGIDTLSRWPRMADALARAIVLSEPEQKELQRSKRDSDRQRTTLALSSQRTMRAALVRFCEWCDQRSTDPLTVTPETAKVYLDQMGPDHVAGWRDLSALRRVFDAAIALELRAPVQPFPRNSGTPSLAVQNDELGKILEKAVRQVDESTRATMRSDLTRLVLAARREGLDALDLTQEDFERLVPEPRDRARVWRPLGRLLTEAKAADLMVGKPNGIQLLATIEARTSDGRRRLLDRYTEWVESQHKAGLPGFETPGMVSLADRDGYLRRLKASGADDEEVQAAREAIRELERKAGNDGERKARAMQMDRFEATLVGLGVKERDIGDLLKVLYAPYDIAVQKAVRALLKLWIEWCVANTVSVLRPRPADYVAFRDRKDGDRPKPRYHYLRTTPIERFVEVMALYKAGGLEGAESLGKKAAGSAAAEPATAPEPVGAA